jgi:hypothetical protein
MLLLIITIVIAGAVRWRILALLHFYVRLHVAVGENGNVPKLAAGCVGFFGRSSHCSSSRGLVAYNDLHAGEGRESKAIHCKPITNLK